MSADLTLYQEHRVKMIALAEQWEQLAEIARMHGELALAHSAADYGSRARFLAEYDPDVEDLFNGTGRWTR